MFKHLIQFEWLVRLRKTSTYLYFSLFVFFTAFAVIMATHGHGFYHRITQAGQGQLDANAPFAIHYLVNMLSSISVLIACAFFAVAGHRDFRNDAHEFMFTLPVSKWHYLIGKFLGAFTVAAFVFSGLPLGVLLAHILPFANQDLMGPMRLTAIWMPYFTSVLPNLFLFGTVFFSIAVLTKRQFPAYVGGLVLMLLNIIALVMQKSMLQLDWAALLDPFGQIAAGQISDYWALVQKNSLLLTLQGSFLINRIFWFSIAVCVFICLYFRFRMQISPGSKHESVEALSDSDLIEKSISNSSRLKLDFSRKSLFLQIVQGTGIELKNILSGNAFRLVLIMGAGLVLFVGFKSVGVVRGTLTWPLTGILLNSLDSSLYLYNVIIVLFASGQMIWRERQKNMHPVLDALPIPESVPFFSKFFALISLQILITGIIQISCLIVQISKSYTDFNWSIYLKDLWGIRFLYFSLIGVFSLFIQSLVNKKFPGYLLVFLFVDDFMPSFGLIHHLYRFAKIPSYIHSDMNGLDASWSGIISYNIFWIAWSLVLGVITILLWNRGEDRGLAARWRQARERLTIGRKGILGCALLVSVLSGGWVLYNTTVLNLFESQKALNKKAVAYEETYKGWEKRAQPLILAVDLDVALYPGKKRAEIEGELILFNHTDSTIRELQIQMPVLGDVEQLSISTAHQIDTVDLVHHVHHMVMETPLAPGDSILLNYQLLRQAKGFRNHRQETRLVKNGAFLDTRHLLPVIGYDTWKECTNSRFRKKNGLPERGRMPPQSNKQARMKTILSSDSRWIRYRATLSTSEDQTIVTVGNPDSSWVQSGRRYTRYRMPGKILKYIPVLSAEYAVVKEEWNEIPIEIYHHPTHTFNLELMMKAAKRSLAIFTDQFGPYPFGSLRLVEFPRYALFAEAFPGLIPISEGYGFIAKHTPQRLEEIYRVVAHEIAHQWFAHQVIGAKVEGQFMLTESMSQYGAFLAVEEVFSPWLVAKYSANEADRYFRGRSREVREEVPLVRTNYETWYLNYAKGFVVLRSLYEMIGPEAMQQATRRFIAEHAFEQPPYAISLDLLKCFKDVTPDSLKYLLTDSFERIVFYDNRAREATAEALPDGRYRVKLLFQSAKIEADSSGYETELVTRDLIPFGIYDADGNRLLHEKRWVSGGLDSLEWIVEGKPSRAGIDPAHIFLDRNTKDNCIDIR